MEKIKTGLWKKPYEDKNGNAKQSLTGSIEIEGKKYWINVYQNTYKDKDSQPDYQLYLKLAEETTVKAEPTAKVSQQGFSQLEDDEFPF